MLELLMQNYDLTYEQAKNLYDMPMQQLLMALDMLNIKNMASKTEIETVNK